MALLYCACSALLTNQVFRGFEICKKRVKHVIAITELMHCLYFVISGHNMFAPDGGSLHSHTAKHTGPSQFGNNVYSYFPVSHSCMVTARQCFILSYSHAETIPFNRAQKDVSKQTFQHFICSVTTTVQRRGTPGLWSGQIQLQSLGPSHKLRLLLPSRNYELPMYSSFCISHTLSLANSQSIETN